MGYLFAPLKTFARIFSIFPSNSNTSLKTVFNHGDDEFYRCRKRHAQSGDDR